MTVKRSSGRAWSLDRWRKQMPVLLLALCTFGTGCDSGNSNNAEVSGFYQGTATTQFHTHTFTFTLLESDGTIAGDGRQVAPGRWDRALVVTGTHVHPNISLTLSPPPGGITMNFTATVSANGATLAGTISGSDFSNETLVLTRQ